VRRACGVKPRDAAGGECGAGGGSGEWVGPQVAEWGKCRGGGVGRVRHGGGGVAVRGRPGDEGERGRGPVGGARGGGRAAQQGAGAVVRRERVGPVGAGVLIGGGGVRWGRGVWESLEVREGVEFSFVVWGEGGRWGCVGWAGGGGSAGWAAEVRERGGGDGGERALPSTVAWKRGGGGLGELWEGEVGLVGGRG